MNIRWSRLATGLLVVAAIVLMSNQSWAIRFGLGPSKDEWKLQYEVAVQEADSDHVIVTLTLADEGRLKPLYSIDLVAFAKQTDSQGGRAYDVNEPIKLQPSADGKRVGQAKFRKDCLDRAKIRLITLTVDGQRQPSGGAYYDIPVAKFLNQAPGADAPVATSPQKPTSKLTK